jgi:RimJ/RimL family protein N-acetyltransferase
MRSAIPLPLVSGDLDLVCAGAPGRREQLDKALLAGRCRPEWCFALRAASRERLAAVTYWAPGPDTEPVIVWHFDPGASPEHGAEILRRTVGTVGARRISRDISLPVGQRPDGEQDGALLAAGFVLEVERLELRWTAGAASGSATGAVAGSGRLTWRAAADLAPGEVLGMVRRIAEGALDHDTRMELEAGRGDQDAREAYDYYASRPDGEFVVGYAGTDAVGLVVTSRLRDDFGLVEFVGVLPEHRGNGYVDDLVARGTASVADRGTVGAGTDTGNQPMAAAFTRAGYAEVERVFRYYWRRDRARQP